MAKLNVFTYENLALYDELLKGKMSEQDAKALKTVAIDGNTLKFYRVEEPVGETFPAYEITLPESDISGLIPKLTGATAGHVVITKADGTVEDGGVALSDLATKADVKVNTDALTKLNSNAETEGSIDYKIAQAVAAIMDNPDETMNSINELVTWINNHAQDALELNNKVSANETAIGNLNTLVGSESVAKQITDAINGLGDLAAKDKVEKTDLATEVQTALEKANNALTEADVKDMRTAVATNTTDIQTLQDLVGEGYQVITEEQIRGLFA